MNAPAPPAGSVDAFAYAAAYAALGWQVFPTHLVRNGRCTCANARCEHPGKHPRTEHGFKDATADLECICRWGDLWHHSNVAVATGTVSGLIVVDIDDERAFEALVDRYGPLPETVEQHTGRGRQLFFLYPEGAAVRSTTEIGGRPGVDVRGDGGYALVPPSKHVNGKTYTWEVSSDPTDGAQLVELPAAWLVLLTRRATHQARRPPGEEQNGVLREGQRNDGLFRLASSIRAKGLSQDDCFSDAFRLAPKIRTEDAELVKLGGRA